MSALPAELAPAFDRAEVQRTVLAAALADPAFQARADAVRGALDEPYRTALAVLARLRAGGRFVDQIVLGAELSKARLPDSRGQPFGAGELMALILNTGMPPGQPEAYLGILQDDLARRRREEVMARVRAAVDGFGGGGLDGLAREVQRIAAEDRAAAGTADEFPSLLAELIPYAADLEQRSRGQRFEGLDTGFEHLNHLANGLGPELFVLAAPPSVGKTTLCWQVACQVAERNPVPVVYVSLEQSKRELWAKLLARLAGVDTRHLLRGRLRADDSTQFGPVRTAFHQAAGYLHHLTVVEGDETTTVDRIRRIVEGKMRRTEADRSLVVIDYLQVIPLSADEAGRVTSPKDKVDLHVSALRRLARDLKVAVLCISSENRAGYRSKEMDVFKESGGIEYGADLAAVLTRDKGGGPDDKAEALDLNLVKNRNGERGVVKFRFYKAEARFVETGREALPVGEEN